MKLIAILFFSFFSLQSFAFEISASWNQQFKRLITLSCTQDDAHLCANLCQDYQKCEIEEKSCGNCGGENNFLRLFFQEVGQSIISSPNEVSPDQLIDLLISGDFMTLDSKSIYNFVDKFNSLELREKFRRLCPMPTEYPLVFIAVHPYTREPEKTLFVTCGQREQSTKIFPLHKVYQLDLNQ